MNRLNKMSLAMSLLGTLATIGAMELPEAKTAISKTQDMKEAVLIAVGPKIIEGELRICLQDSIIYECGKCRWDEKNLTSNYSLLYQPHDPVVPITKCIVGTDNGIPGICLILCSQIKNKMILFDSLMIRRTVVLNWFAVVIIIGIIGNHLKNA